ncbi:MAG: TlpA family protein disulfide reductase [Ilumatobacteraceae bacterium]
MRVRLSPLVLGTGAGLLAALVTVLVVVTVTDDDTSEDLDVVLDVPGEYQQPGIGTNAPVVGRQLSAAEVLDLNGGTVDTTQFSDGRPLLINFWFSNCQPCKREMPALEDAHRIYGDQVRFIGINPQDSPEITRSFAEDLGIDYELFRDPNGEFVVANGVATFPTTFFVGVDGSIRIQKAGELSPADIETALQELLNGT